MKLNGQVGTVIDTLLLIARAVMAMLYSRIIHRLRNDETDLYATYEKEEIDKFIAETVKRALLISLTDMQQKIVSHLEACLSQNLDERLTALDAKQAEAFVRFKAEQITAISETNEAIIAPLETALRKNVRETRLSTDRPPSSNVRSLTEVASRKQRTSSKGEHDIDTIIWPLLNSGMTVRAIAERTNTSTATVGRCRKRWEAAQKKVSVDQPETDRMIASLSTN